MLASDAMSREGVTISPNATVVEAASLLANTRVSALPVVGDAGQLVGIVSEADVINHIALGTNPPPEGERGHVVADVMTADVITIEPETPLTDGIKLMVDRHLKLVPVCRSGEVIGTLSRSDITRIVASKADGPGTSPPAADAALRDAVLRALQGHDWSLAQRFDVVVKDRTVHLWGVVPSEKVLQTYLAAARQAGESKSLVSHMHVMRHGVRMVSLA